jgi:hypothetical protein
MGMIGGERDKRVRQTMHFIEKHFVVFDVIHENRIAHQMKPLQ